MSKKTVSKKVVLTSDEAEKVDKTKPKVAEVAEVSNVTYATKQDIEEIKTSLTSLSTSLNNIEKLVKDFKKDLKGLVEIQQRLVHERLGAPIPPPPKEYGEEPSTKSSTKIEITNMGDDRIKISGKTFDFKDAIKGAGSAKFDQATKSWTLPIDSLDELVKNFEAINLVKDTDFSVNVKINPNVKKEKEEEEEGFGSGFS